MTGSARFYFNYYFWSKLCYCLSSELVQWNLSSSVTLGTNPCCLIRQVGCIASDLCNTVDNVVPVWLHYTDNAYSNHAVAVVQDGEVVGHVPKCKSELIFYLFGYDGNVGFCEVTGVRVWNHCVGLGLEVACIYNFFRKKSYLQRLQKLMLIMQLDHVIVLHYNYIILRIKITCHKKHG